MIYHRRTSRQAAQVARSQLAVRLGIAVYAALGAAVLLRCTVLALQFPESVWTVQAIRSASAPVVFPFRFTPAVDRSIVGLLTLADLTALMVVLAVPLLLVGRRRISPLL